MNLEIGVGSSSQADVYAAGQEAAEQVVSHLAGRRPDLVLVFSSIRFADPRMLKAVRSMTQRRTSHRLHGCGRYRDLRSQETFRYRDWTGR